MTKENKASGRTNTTAAGNKSFQDSDAGNTTVVEASSSSLIPATSGNDLQMPAALDTSISKRSGQSKATHYSAASQAKIAELEH